jgi:hypothetical protein
LPPSDIYEPRRQSTSPTPPIVNTPRGAGSYLWNFPLLWFFRMKEQSPVLGFQVKLSII